MAFVERTDWVDTPSAPAPPGSTPVRAEGDIKRWERGIAEAHEEIDGRLSDASLNSTYAPVSVASDLSALDGEVVKTINGTAPDAAGNVVVEGGGTVSVSGPDIIAYGDSLTAGQGGEGTNWPAVVASATGLTVINAGNAGEFSSDVAARQGSSPLLALPAGGQIPASGPVNVTLTRASDGAVTTKFIRLGPKRVNPVRIAGVDGALTWNGTNYVFTRTTAGAAVTVNRPTPVSIYSSRTYGGNVHIIWVGRNNVAEPDQIAGDIAAMIDHMDAVEKRYLVVGVTTGMNEGTGHANHTAIVALNKQLAQRYGRRFVDIRRYMVSYGLADAGITPTGEDTTNLGNDTMPPSLMFDNLHFNSTGYTVIGNVIAGRLAEFGWAEQSVPVDPPSDLYSLGVDGADRRYIADTIAGASITSFDDLVGTDHLATSGTNPTVTTHASGHKYVSADGNAQLASLNPATPPLTVAVVMRRMGTGLFALEVGGYRIRAASGLTTWQMSGSGSTTLSGSDTRKFAVVVARVDAANSKLIVDGAAPASMGITGPAASGVSIPLKSAYGSADSTDIAEIVTWPTALSDADMETVRAAMAAQYGAMIGT